MIETPAQRQAREKREAPARAARAAAHAEKMRSQLQPSNATPAAVIPGEEQPFTKLTALAFTAEINRDAERVGDKLLRAHRLKIWEPLGFKSWKEYVAEKLKFSRAHAYRLLNHAETIEQLPASPTGDTPSESQTRPLNGLPAPAKRKAWKRAVKDAGGQPTAKQVAAAVAAAKPANATVISTEQNLPMHTAADTLPKKANCPHCGQPMP